MYVNSLHVLKSQSQDQALCPFYTEMLAFYCTNVGCRAGMRLKSADSSNLQALGLWAKKYQTPAKLF